MGSPPHSLLYKNDKFLLINFFHSFNIQRGFWKEEKVFINHLTFSGG